MPLTASPEKPAIASATAPRPFEFARDSFAFANELHWEYAFDQQTGKTTFSKRDPKPTYAHRCFVLTCAARQFLYHAHFEPKMERLQKLDVYRWLIKQVVRRNPRVACAAEERVTFPGFASLHEFSQAHGQLLKDECGGAWRSYVLRSHWRMVFPISRQHQEHTAASLLAEIQCGHSPIIHLVLFPKLTINHGMVLFDAKETPANIVFQAYDPNEPAQPTTVSFDRITKTFSLPANRYWAGGTLDIIEIYRSWWM